MPAVSASKGLVERADCCHKRGMQKWLENFEEVLGAQLQSVKCGESTLVLGFYDHGDSQFIWFNFQGQLSHMGKSPHPPKISKSKKPVGLFLAANVVGQHLRSVQFSGDKLLLIFDDARFNFWWQEDGLNLKAQTPEKSIHWLKPLPAKPWIEFLSRGSMQPSAQPTLQQPKVDPKLAKLTRALTRVEEELGEKKNQNWRELAEFLKLHPPSELPIHLRALFDESVPVHSQIDMAFAKAKTLERKIKGTEARREKLLTEMDRFLKGDSVDSPEPRSRLKAPKEGMLHTRKLALANGLTAYVGKSAADNLNLLRQAQPWFYWLHLRDEPASHCILHRPKNQEPSAQQLAQLNNWYLQTFFKNRAKKYHGQKFDILMAECRYVKPVKGAKGLVTYTHEKVVRHTFSTSGD